MFELDDKTRRRIYDSIAGVLPVEKIFLFGSYARGEQRPDSDIDLYVIVEHDGAGLESNYAANLALLWLLDHDVPYDVFVSDQAAFSSRSNIAGTLEYSVSQEGVSLHV